MNQSAQTHIKNYDAIVIGGGIGGLSFAAVSGGAFGEKKYCWSKKMRPSAVVFIHFIVMDLPWISGLTSSAKAKKGPLGNVLKAVGKDGEITWKPRPSHDKLQRRHFCFPQRA